MNAPAQSSPVPCRHRAQLLCLWCSGSTETVHPAAGSHGDTCSALQEPEAKVGGVRGGDMTEPRSVCCKGQYTRTCMGGVVSGGERMKGFFGCEEE